MPDLSGYDLAVLGLVAILLIHSLQDPPELPEPAGVSPNRAPTPPIDPID